MRTWHKEYLAYAAALCAAGAGQHLAAGSLRGVQYTALLIGAMLFFGEADSIADRNREALEAHRDGTGQDVLSIAAECAPKLPRKLFWGNVLLACFALGIGAWVSVVSVARFFVYPKWRRRHRGRRQPVEAREQRGAVGAGARAEPACRESAEGHAGSR